MRALIDFIIAIVGGFVTMFSWRAAVEAQRTGRLRLFFWHIAGWGERAKNPSFFRTSLRMQYFRTIFFALVTMIAGYAFVQDIGAVIF